jgi:hypothetical protein
MFTMKSEVVGWPSVVSDDLVQRDVQKVLQGRRFTISQLSYEFPQISRTLPYEIIIDWLRCLKFCARWVPENAHGCAQNADNGFGLDFFLDRYHKDDEFLVHILRVTSFIPVHEIAKTCGDIFISTEDSRSI